MSKTIPELPIVEEDWMNSEEFYQGLDKSVFGPVVYFLYGEVGYRAKLYLYSPIFGRIFGVNDCDSKSSLNILEPGGWNRFGEYSDWLIKPIKDWRFVFTL